MSEYSAVLSYVKEHTGKTAAQIAAGMNLEVTGVSQVLAMLTTDGRVTKTGSGGSATYASTSEQ